MKTEEIIFTEKMFALLYERAFEYCKANYGFEMDLICLEHGKLKGIYVDRYGYKRRYDIDLNELTSTNSDLLIAERFERERIQNEKEAEERRISKEVEDYKKYLELKAKFENK